MGKFARFSVFARGRIVGKAEEGASQKKIRRTVLKKDGRRGSLRAIQGIIEHSRKEPGYDGSDSSAGGRPRELTSAEDNQLAKLIHDEVGSAVVTIKYCKKRLSYLRHPPLNTEVLRNMLVLVGTV